MPRNRRVIGLGWICIFAIACQVAVKAGDDRPTSDAPQARRQANDEITKNLPPVPEAIAKLIADGNVVFDFFDEKDHQYRFPGETTFDFRYQYRCRTGYRLVDLPPAESPSEVATSANKATYAPSLQTSPGKALSVTIHYEEVTLSISHRMRLPSRLVSADFFELPLVRHEFDHVAISADRRLQPLLIQMLTERNAMVIVPLSIDQAKTVDRQLYATMARTAASEETTKVFEDFVSLVRIRYKELDQITQHGVLPLEPDKKERLLRF